MYVIRDGARTACALLTAKVKTINLLGRSATVAVAAEAPTEEIVRRNGPAPDIYSADINYWLWQVAIDLLEQRPELELVYVHTTDYRCTPGAPTTRARSSTWHSSMSSSAPPPASATSPSTPPPTTA